MSIQVWEGAYGPEAEQAKKSSGQRVYWVTGTDTEGDVISAVATAAPAVVDCGGKLAVRVSITPRRKGGAVPIWETSVKYADEDDPKSEQPPAELDWHFSFDTMGGDHEITHSLETINRYYRTYMNKAPDLKTAMGWDGKKLNGAKIVIPKLEFSVEFYYHPAAVTTGLAAALARKTGYVCSDETWLGFAEGEVLFLGAQGKGDRPLISGARVKPAQVTYKFAVSETKDITLPDINLDKDNAAITSFEKQGWDYLWVYYTVKDTVDGITYPTPEWAYVERVYPRMNFASFFGVS